MAKGCHKILPQIDNHKGNTSFLIKNTVYEQAETIKQTLRNSRNSHSTCIQHYTFNKKRLCVKLTHGVEQITLMDLIRSLSL